MTTNLLRPGSPLLTLMSRNYEDFLSDDKEESSGGSKSLFDSLLASPCDDFTKDNSLADFITDDSDSDESVSVLERM